MIVNPEAAERALSAIRRWCHVVPVKQPAAPVADERGN